jgi:hypothetical protein
MTGTIIPHPAHADSYVWTRITRGWLGQDRRSSPFDYVGRILRLHAPLLVQDGRVVLYQRRGTYVHAAVTVQGEVFERDRDHTLPATGRLSLPAWRVISRLEEDRRGGSGLLEELSSQQYPWRFGMR